MKTTTRYSREIWEGGRIKKFSAATVELADGRTVFDYGPSGRIAAVRAKVCAAYLSTTPKIPPSKGVVRAMESLRQQYYAKKRRK
jgi:hypothetical protein